VESEGGWCLDKLNDTIQLVVDEIEKTDNNTIYPRLISLFSEKVLALRDKTVLFSRKVMQIERLICFKCGNTEEFIVDSQRLCACATLHFDEDEACLEDEYPDDIEIIPVECAKCGANEEWIGSSFFLEEINEVVCQHCSFRFQCYTEKDKCIGFMFKNEHIELV
jgi:hypothetical protein